MCTYVGNKANTKVVCATNGERENIDSKTSLATTLLYGLAAGMSDQTTEQWSVRCEVIITHPKPSISCISFALLASDSVLPSFAAFSSLSILPVTLPSLVSPPFIAYLELD